MACQGCANSTCKDGVCTFPQRLLKKYPYVIATNFVAVCMYIVLTAWWFLEEFVYRIHYESIHNFLASHPQLFTFIVLMISIILIVAPIYLLLKYCKKNDLSRTQKTRQPQDGNSANDKQNENEKPEDNQNKSDEDK